MATAVVDASVALKWQLDDEEHVEQALALRDDFVKGGKLQLRAPSLWVYELVNGLAVAARQGRIRQADAVDGLRDILALGVEEKRPNPVRIYALAQEHGLSAYDAAYLALAESEGAELWTGDRQLHQATADKLTWVKWIGDY